MEAIRTFWAVLDLFGGWQVMFPESRFAQFRKPVRLRLTKLAPLGAHTMSTDQPEKPARRAGRQPKATPKQSHTISVRLTDAEYQVLEAEAKEYRKSMGEVLRAVWVGTPDEARARKPRTAEELEERRQLVGMAVNLDQLTKQLHAGSEVREAAQQALERLNLLLAN